ncbi:MAG: GNAT family N-acetyltransferase, partial [Paracoccaceae bacterium]
PGPVPADWEERLLTGICLVAEAPRGTAVGFATLSADGYLDFLYVAPDWMGRGVAGALYDPLEMQARAFGVTALSTEASHLARRFLERRGWRVEARQSVIRHGVPITNFRMEKQLSA